MAPVTDSGREHAQPTSIDIQILHVWSGRGPLKWPKSCALGDNSDFEQRPLRDQFCNANRSPVGVWRSDEFVFDLDERVQMFPQFHMISGHFDHVAEVKTAVSRCVAANLNVSRNCVSGLSESGRPGCTPVIPERNTNSPVSRIGAKCH
jgi:hypothetical protein